MTSSISSTWVRSALGALALVMACLVGCSDENTPAVVTEVACETSADCEGGLCLLDICRECASDEACVSDDVYGQGAVCVDGACEGCQGEEGCACEGDACDEGLSCEDGACVACPVGAEGCACFGNGTCAEGLACEDGACAEVEVCEPGTEGCPCDEEGACGEGLLCEGDVCTPEECVPGAQGCPCDEEGACEEGLTCFEDMCAPEDCELGELDCPCRDDEEDACDEGLACLEEGMCAECTPEIEGCPCDEDGECGEELVCDEDEELCREPAACEDLGCVTNQLCEDAEPGIDARCLEACAEGFEFNLDTGTCDEIQEANANCQADTPGSILLECGTQNRACVEADDTATCEGCLPGFLEEGGACRTIVTCADLACDGDNRECTVNTDLTDAVCAGCLMGFEDNDGVCERIPQANCQEDLELSILSDCNDRNRLCVENNEGAECAGCFNGFAEDPETQQCVRRLCEDLNCGDLRRECGGEPLAACGECEEGTVPEDANDPLSQCRDLRTCDDIECGEGETCAVRDGADPVCSEWPCVDFNGDPDFNQAFSDFGGGCIDCGIVCDDEGQTGRIWPFTLEASNRCICETTEGFYFDTSELFTALACDADDDGWVRVSARAIIESGDPALEDNARCDLKTIDRFTLENEYRQRMDVLICDSVNEVPFVGAFECETNDDCGAGGRCNDGGTCECVVPSEMDLYESVRNDDQAELESSNPLDVPSVTNGRGRGRQLVASEINPMTRACVPNADYNNNGAVDIDEWQGFEPVNAEADTLRFTQFSYFMELHDGFFEDVANNPVDRYVIREKSRCDAGFPVQYDPSIDSAYSSQCARSRDVAYDNTGDNALNNHDFAAWGCPQEAESCPIAPPLTDVTPDGEVPVHGLCDDEVTLPPVDGIWRGMNHASQFKCTQLVNTLPDDRDIVAPHQRTEDELVDSEGVSGELQLNRCSVACPEGSDVTVDKGTFANVSRWTFNGDAVQTGSVLSLTANLAEQVGSAFLTEPFDTTESASFVAAFEFRTDGDGSGISFIIQNSPAGADALSGSFNRNGYNSITDSVAVEFDMTLNEGANDPDANHIAVLAGGDGASHLAVASPAFGMDNGELNLVWITYDGASQELAVFIAQSGEARPDTPVLTHTIDLLAQVGEQAYFGFGGSGGGSVFGSHMVERFGLITGAKLDETPDAACEADCDGGVCGVSTEDASGNPDRPVIECSPVSREDAEEGMVGFAAVRFIESPGLYVRGCIDEFTPSVFDAEALPWKNLCPGFAQNPAGVVGQGNPGNFGLIVCGCGFNYGGANCDQGCASADLHIGGNNTGDTCSNGYCPVSADGDGGGRRGFWMCGGLSTVSYEGTDVGQIPALRNGEWSLEGEIADQGIEGSRLCQDETCESGWSLQ